MMTKVAVTLKSRSERLRDVAFSIKPLSGLTILARSRLSVRDLVHDTSEDSELLLYQKDKCGLPDLEPDQEQELEFTCNFSPEETNFRVMLPKMASMTCCLI
jgi:hypothetical protein